MKDKIHPQYFESIKIICSCGNVVLAGSTKKEIQTEICSACHPFYTGQQKLVDTAGRVDKFLAKVKKAQTLKGKAAKKANDGVDEMYEGDGSQTELAPAEEAPKAKKTTKKAAAKKG